MGNANDPRSPIARAMAWASEVTAIALEMVVPAVIGLWIDQKLGTKLVFLIVGVAVGATGGIVHLLRMAQRWQVEQNKRRKVTDNDKGDPPGSAAT